MAHLLSAFDALQARLRSALDAAGHSAVRVTGVSELGRPDGTVVMPAVFVVLDGLSVLELAALGNRARLGLRWLVVVAVRSVADLGSGAQARALAGPLADVVLGTLMGYTPPESAAPLALQTGPAPIYQEGVFYLPLAFEQQLVRRTL